MSVDSGSIESQFNINAANSGGEKVYEFEQFRLDARRLMLYRDGIEVDLAPKVVETLLALVENAGRIVSKEELFDRLWKDSFVDESNLTQNIYLLRKTLGNTPDGRPLIETFRRRGYRFNGLPQPTAFERPAKPTAEKRITYRSLAVLPFENEGEGPEFDYLSDGITESIINRMSAISSLRVMARSTVFRYKHSELTPQEIGRELTVDAVLTGRLLRHGDRLIIRVELVDAANGWQLWGAQYQRSHSDIFEMQETIAGEISENLKLKLSNAEQTRLLKRHTDSVEAYHSYIKGRYYLNRRLTETVEQAAVHFQRSIDADPWYASAYVGLADSYPLLSLYGSLAPHEAYPKAREAAETALQLDPGLTTAYNSLGVVKLFYEWDWAGAEAAFQEAIQLSPGYPDAHLRYGMLLTAVSRFDEAEKQFEKALELDPLSLITLTINGYPFYYSGRYGEAAERFRAVIAMDESYSMAHFRLGLNYAQQGKFDEAIGELNTSNRLSNDRDSIAGLGYVLGRSGKRAEAEKVLNELEERAKAGFVSAYDRALVCVGLGRTSEALDWLEKAHEERSYWLIYLKVDPILAALRTEARFGKLLAKVF